MKVICINAEAWPKNISHKENNNGVIEDGEIYDVIDVELDEGYIWFELSVDIGFTYWENCFSRVSEINETELLEQRQHELVNNETTV